MQAQSYRHRGVYGCVRRRGRAYDKGMGTIPVFTSRQNEGERCKGRREMLDRKWEKKRRITEFIVLGIFFMIVAGVFTVADVFTVLVAFLQRGSSP